VDPLEVESFTLREIRVEWHAGDSEVNVVGNALARSVIRSVLASARELAIRLGLPSGELHRDVAACLALIDSGSPPRPGVSEPDARQI